MSWLDALKHRFRPLVRPGDYQRELDEEVRLHLALDAAQQGEAPDADAAARAARLHFGPPTVHREEARRMTILGWLDVVRQDARYGWRALLRSPGFTATAVLSLALGIGANTAIFSLIYGLLLEPLPLPRPAELVTVRGTVDQGNPAARGRPGSPTFTVGEFDELRRTPGIERFSFFTGVGDVAVDIGDQHDFAMVQVVDGHFFGLAEVRPLAGRLIAPADDEAKAPVVVISEVLWERYFHRDPAAIGKTITLHGNPFAVIGVTPRSYRGMVVPGMFEAGVPAGAATLLGVPDFRGAGGPPVMVVGRLHDPAALPSLSSAVNETYKRCCAGGRLSGAGANGNQRGGAPPMGVRLVEVSHGIPLGKFDLRRMFGPVLLILMAGVVVVLLIACANVGNLLLARATARSRELAVRLAMGASRGRIVRQLLTESAELALLGGTLGFLLAAWGTAALKQFLPAQVIAFSDFVTLRPTPALLGFTAAVSIGCVLLFGLVPALRATRTDLVTPLKEGGDARAGRSGMLSRALVVGQVAFALLLVTAATLLSATLRNLRNVDGGFAVTHVVMADVDTRGTSYEAGGIVPLHQELLERVRRIPGVRAAAASTQAPIFGGRTRDQRIEVPGYIAGPREQLSSSLVAVTPGWFDVMGIRLVSGRDFSMSDGATAQRVVIVSEMMVHDFWAGRDPVGQTMRIGGDSMADYRVVGVVKDAKYMDLRSAAVPMMYLPLVQSGSWPFVEIALRSEQPADVLAAPLRREVRSFAPELRVRSLAGMEETVEEALARERLAAGLAALVGLMALGLAAVGLYGLVSYNVTRRSAEIGIRMALGARTMNVVWLVLRNSLVLVGIGVAIGAPLTFVGGRAMAALLYGVGAHDPLLLAAAALVLVAAAGLASAVPAMRAARVDPLKALRAG